MHRMKEQKYETVRGSDSSSFDVGGRASGRTTGCSIGRSVLPAEAFAEDGDMGLLRREDTSGTSD
jgi:hypothetical protein